MAISLNEGHIKHIGFLEPPGCMREILLHPFHKNQCIELALFQEHRFAFYYWLKWTNEGTSEIPSLISYDWHQDLAPPYKDELPELRALDPTNKGEIALYTWAKLSHLNDVQIRAALLLNKLQDVYVICRQAVRRKNQEVIIDFFGNEHTVYIFKSDKEFEDFLPQIQDERVYLDIDLDFFTFGNPTSQYSPFDGKGYTYMKTTDIKQFLSVNNPTIKWIFKRLAGITIATEPEFCGGLKRPNYFLKMIEDAYFTPSLFLNQLQGKGTSWKQEVLSALEKS